jgi:outer membrane protein
MQRIKNWHVFGKRTEKQKTKMKRTFLLLAILLTAWSISMAQDKKWTLEDCINYAVANNIGLQRQKLQTETADANYLKSVMDILPSVNMGSNGSIAFGRNIDPRSNLITFKQSLSNSYYISSRLNLFNGFSTLNTLSANRYMEKAGIEAEKVARNTLIINILGQYYQVVYSKGLEDASRMKFEISQKQLFRINKLVETGREALSKQYEMESQVSADRLDYTIAQNNASQALTTLKQMLQIEAGTEFDVVVPDLNSLIFAREVYNTDSIYSVAAEVMPRLRAIEYELRGNRKQLSAARGNILPRLTAEGQLFTGYYKSDEAGDQLSFSSQLKNNNSQAVLLSLEIPLFNNYSTGRNIRLARIRRDDTRLKLDQERNALYTEIENACLNLNRGQDEFAAAVANYDFNIKSFEALEKKFESGLIDVTDYSAARTKLFIAETESMRTKLQLLIRRMTIQFYTTGEYQNLLTSQFK